MVPVFAADTLLVSNDPERLMGPMALFSYTAPVQHTVRILYHHKNVSDIPLHFSIVAKSLSASGNMSVVLASAGPVADEIFAGHKAIERYWEKLGQKKIPLPIDLQERELLAVVVRPGEVVSGVFECQSDVSTLFEGRVIDPEYPAASYAAMRRVSHAPIYSSTTIRHHVAYTVGDVVGEIPIGVAPFVYNQFSGDVLKGNYGVMYEVYATLDNPEIVTRDVSLLFSPLGGVARAMIRVGGDRLYETGNVGGVGFPAVVEVLKVKVAPKSIYNLVFEVIPQSGSYYPVHFVLRAEGPASLTVDRIKNTETAMTHLGLQESNNGY